MYPPLTTFVSLMNSVESGVPMSPNPGLFTESPSTMYEFSGEVDPAIDVPNVSVCAPGVTSATASNDRFADPLPPGAATGTRLVKSLVIVVPVELEPTSTTGARAHDRHFLCSESFGQKLDIDA
jgi:hypothetical protein